MAKRKYFQSNVQKFINLNVFSLDECNMSMFITVIQICGLNWWGSNYYIYKWDSIVMLEEESTFYYHILHIYIIDAFKNLSFGYRNFTLWISSGSNDCKYDLLVVLLCSRVAEGHSLSWKITEQNWGFQDISIQRSSLCLLVHLELSHVHYITRIIFISCIILPEFNEDRTIKMGFHCTRLFFSVIDNFLSFYFFIFDFSESLLLHRLFSSCDEQGLL